MIAQLAERALEIGREPLYVVHTPPRAPLTVAVRRWPLATPVLRPHLRLDEMLWRPCRRLPTWLQSYLLVELPAPAVTLPAAPSPFRAGLAAVPSCLAVQGVLAGVHHADAVGAWGRSGTRSPAFTYRKAGGIITASMRPPWDGTARPPLDGAMHAPLDGTARPPRGGREAGAALAALWGAVKDLCDLDGDVLLAVLAHALDRAEPDGTTWITADAILDDRGIRPKTERAGPVRYRAGHRREDRERVAASVERLERLWVQLQDIALLEPRPGARPRRTRLTHEGKLLLVADRLMQDGLPVAWRYRPGPWLDPFLLRPNRQTALLAQQVLRYDPYHECWEKRLAGYVTFHLRMDAGRAAPLVRRIGPLLDELNLPVDRRHPERTRARFEGALGRLVRDGVIGAWSYTPAAQDTLASLPARRWIDTWRGLTITVRPAAAVAAHYAAMAARLPTTRAERHARA